MVLVHELTIVYAAAPTLVMPFSIRTFLSRGLNGVPWLNPGPSPKPWHPPLITHIHPFGPLGSLADMLCHRVLSKTILQRSWIAGRTRLGPRGTPVPLAVGHSVCAALSARCHFPDRVVSVQLAPLYSHVDRGPRGLGGPEALRRSH